MARHTRKRSIARSKAWLVGGADVSGFRGPVRDGAVVSVEARVRRVRRMRRTDGIVINEYWTDAGKRRPAPQRWLG